MRRPILGLGFVGLLASVVHAQDFEPRNVECIAPANPGGGWDFTCRTVGRLLTDLGLVPGPVTVTNMPGSVGGVGYAHVASKRADDPNLLVATSTVAITNLAQGRYPEDIDAMRWLAMLGADVAVVLVRSDSEYGSLDDLLETIDGDPASLIAGGSSGVGGWDHIRLLMLAQAAGVPLDRLPEIRWVEYSAGGDAVKQLIGEYLDVVVTDVGEVGEYLRSDEVEALAVMASERLEAYPDLPTASELGYEAEGYNWRGFYMGGDVSDDAYDTWVTILEDLYNSQAWTEAATEAGLTPIWRGGKEMEAFARISEEQAQDIGRAIGVID